MSDFETLQEQISAQITGMYTFDVSFVDAENEAFRLIDSADGFWVWPLFKKPKQIKRAKAQILIKLATDFILNSDVREFDLEPKLTYNEFMDEFYNSSVMTLNDYIMYFHDDKKASFARKNNVRPQQITQWIKKKFIVVDDVLYSPRRDLVT